MCGIFGRFSWAGSADPEQGLAGFIELLRHRGPDEGGYWAEGPFFLGHRRLSIIDLTTGAQPMGIADGRLVITFNGEIYNFRDLREELAAHGRIFRTSSDTEVLLHGYLEWGEELPRRLVGMFAFAIADRGRRELFLARDAFGEKPLLYRDAVGSVFFASELRPLAALPGLPRRIDEGALGAYLCLNYVPGEATLLDGVRRVPPGSWRRYASDGSVTTGLHYSPPAPASRGRRLEVALEELRERLDRAVRYALVSDVPVGIFLSGGIDSSLVAKSASDVGRITRAFCLDFPDEGYSEWPKAQRVAERLGIPLHRVRMGPGAAADFLLVVEHADDPLADSSALAVWTISREAAGSHKVVLGGDGGDELFGGYLTYRASQLHAGVLARLPGVARRGLTRLASALDTSEGKVSPSYQAMRFLRAAGLPTGEAHFSWNGTWLPHEAAGLTRSPAVREAAEQALARLAERHGLRARPDLLAFQRADIGDYLPNDILTKVDRMSMAHGLEVRAPFLQPALAEFALTLPPELRCPPLGPPKRLLRELARRCFGSAIADARKQGFSIPIHTWLRGPLRSLADELLAPSAIDALRVLDPAAVDRVWREHRNGRRSWGWEVWGLMVLSSWHRVRVAQPPAPGDASGLVRRRIPFRDGQLLGFPP